VPDFSQRRAGRSLGDVGAVRAYQAICQLTGAGVDAAGTRGTDQLPACPRLRDQHSHGFSPDRLDLALAAFLLKILMSAFFVRDRPGRASPRKSKQE
jgi:hypothetical protein